MPRATTVHIVMTGWLAAAMAACSSDVSDTDHEHEHEHEHGEATGAVCSDASTLTYESFGQDFMAKYCTSCHAATVTGAARQGAPEGFDFDTVEGVRDHADEIDEHAGIGPMAENREMPLDDPLPTDDERSDLAEWLACGAP